MSVKYSMIVHANGRKFLREVKVEENQSTKILREVDEEGKIMGIGRIDRVRIYARDEER